MAKSKSTSRVTSLTEVARHAGVSVATASRVLNGSPLATAGTTRKVMEVANRLGYAPNPRFRAMGQNRGGAERRPGPIGILLPTQRETDFVANPYYSRMFWSMEREARRQNRQLFISALNDDATWNVPNFIQDLGVDGVVITTPYSPAMLRGLEGLLPVVLLNTTCEDDTVKIPSIMPDEDSGIRQSLRYLVELGHRRIVYFGIHDGMRNVHHVMRHAAFGRWVHELMLDQARSVILPGRIGSMEETAKSVLEGWKRSGELPTALLCGADVYAIPFLAAAESLGISVPGDMSIIGIDDTVFCDYTRPKLTSVRQPLEVMGAKAVELLLNRIRGGDDESVSLKFDVALIQRESCGELSAKP